MEKREIEQIDNNQSFLVKYNNFCDHELSENTEIQLTRNDKSIMKFTVIIE